MKIDKITFKESQAWIVIKSDDGDYLGTWHSANPEFVNAIRKENPTIIRIM